MARQNETGSSRRRAPVVAALLAIALLVAACGGDDEGARGEQAANGGSAGGFPQTFEHARGSTTIESAPERVVAVGYTDHEILLGLGVHPIGAMDWFADDTYAKWPWEPQSWKDDPGAVVANAAGELDFERIASLRPDLIVGLYADLDQETYDKLSQLAPTVAQAKGVAYTTSWREMLRTAGRALGRSERAEKQIARVDERFAQIREEHPEFATETAVVVDAGTAPKSYWPFTSTDPRGQFMRELGFKPAPAIDKAAGATFGFELSSERVDLLDVDRLILLIDADAKQRLDRDKLFNQLDVARDGRVVSLPYYSSTQVGAALAFNTALSIDYALDGILPELTR